MFDRCRDVRLLTLDLPGFGASAKTPGHRHTIHAAADAVEALWAARGIDVDAARGARLQRVGRSGAAGPPQRGWAGVELTGVVWMNGGVYPDLHRPTLGQQLLLDPEQGAEFAAGMTEELFTGGIAGTWGERVPLDARSGPRHLGVDGCRTVERS